MGQILHGSAKTSARPAGSRRGRPRMTMESKEAGLDVGERRVRRLMMTCHG